MDALSDKMQARLHALIVKVFKLLRELDEETVAYKEVTVPDSVALKDPDTSHELAEVQPILTRQEVSK